MKQFSIVFRKKPLVLLFFCLAVSLAAGSIWGNGLSEQVQRELGVLGQAWLNQSGYTAEPDGGLLVSVILKRTGEAAVLWLAGMTSFSAAGLCGAVLLLGFSMAAVLSVLTIETGVLALPLFVLSLFPQCLFYIPVAAVLTSWGIREEKKRHGAAFLILLVMVAAGAASEVLLSPRWMKLVGGIFKKFVL